MATCPVYYKPKYMVRYNLCFFFLRLLKRTHGKNKGKQLLKCAFNKEIERTISGGGIVCILACKFSLVSVMARYFESSMGGRGEGGKYRQGSAFQEGQSRILAVVGLIFHNHIVIFP